MTEPDNLLHRLRQNRIRSNVTKPDDQLTETVPDSNLEHYNNNTLLDLKAQLAQYPETNRHSAIVLDKQLDIQLTRYCKEQKITVETFLEAAWALAHSNPQLLQQITDSAILRYKSRKEAGKLRRLITMLSKHSP